MNSVQIVCLLLAVRPVTGNWVFEEKFKASGCGTADLVETNYEWTETCRKYQDATFYKKVCAGSKITMSWYTEKTCTTAHGTMPSSEENVACTENTDDGVWEKRTCGSAPSSSSSASKYPTSSCTTADLTDKAATGTCMVRHTQSSGAWVAGSTKYDIEGTATNTTGLVIKTFTNSDCSGTPASTMNMGTQCANLGDGYWTSIDNSAVASFANSICKLSPLVVFLGTAAMLKYF